MPKARRAERSRRVEPITGRKSGVQMSSPTRTSISVNFANLKPVEIYHPAAAEVVPSSRRQHQMIGSRRS
jgi:hypothetical protein